MININKPNFRCKSCNRIKNFNIDLRDYYINCTPEEKQKCLKEHNCLDCRIIIKERILNIPDSNKGDSRFYCNKCKEYTNDKTPTTTCVVCNTPLIRNNIFIWK